MPRVLPLSLAPAGRLGGSSRVEAGDPGPWAGVIAVPRRKPAGFRLPGKVLFGKGAATVTVKATHAYLSSSSSPRPADRGSLGHCWLSSAEPGLSFGEQGLTFCVCRHRSLRTVLLPLGSVWENSQPWCLPEPWSFVKVHGRVWLCSGVSSCWAH